AAKNQPLQARGGCPSRRAGGPCPAQADGGRGPSRRSHPQAPTAGALSWTSRGPPPNHPPWRPRRPPPASRPPLAGGDWLEQVVVGWLAACPACSIGTTNCKHRTT